MLLQIVNGKNELILWNLSSIQMKMLNDIACNLNFVLTELNSNFIEIGAKGI
jgi:hypothetical protein